MIRFPFLPVEGLHEFNLDWFLNKFRELLEEWDVTKAAWLALKEYVENFFDNLDVQEEINNKLDEMLAAGDFTPIFNTLIPIFVDRWLQDNIESVTTASIDRSMQSTVLSAAAFDLGTAYTSILPYISAKRGFSDIDEIGGINEKGVNTNNRKYVRSHLVFVDTDECNRIKWNLSNALWGNYEYRVFYYREVNGQNTFIGSTPYKSLDTESLAGEGMKYKILLHKKDDANMDETDLAYANNNLILYRSSNGTQIIKDKSVALNQTVAVVAENSLQSVVGGDLDSWQQGQLGTQNGYRVSYRQLIKLAPGETLSVWSDNCLNFQCGIVMFESESDFPSNVYDTAAFANAGCHSYYNDTDKPLYCHVIFARNPNDEALSVADFLAETTPYIKRHSFNDYDNIGSYYWSRHSGTINGSGNNYANSLEYAGAFATEFMPVKEGDVIMARVVDRLNRTTMDYETFNPLFIYTMFSGETMVARRTAGYIKKIPYTQKNIYIFKIPEGVTKIACAANTHYTSELYVSNLSNDHNSPFTMFKDNLTFGHRGMRYWGEDNDIVGFINAIKAGIRNLEIDIIQSADGVLYCSHDDTVTTFDGTQTFNINQTNSNVLDANLYKSTSNMSGLFYYQKKGRKLWRVYDILRLFKPYDIKWFFDVKTASFVSTTFDTLPAQGITDFVDFIKNLELFSPDLSQFIFSRNLFFARNRAFTNILEGQNNDIAIQPYQWISAETLSSRLKRLDAGTLGKWIYLERNRFYDYYVAHPEVGNWWYFYPGDTLIIDYEYEPEQNYARSDELINAMYDAIYNNSDMLKRNVINFKAMVYNTLVGNDNFNLMTSCNSITKITSDKQPSGLVCSDILTHMIDELN